VGKTKLIFAVITVTGLSIHPANAVRSLLGEAKFIARSHNGHIKVHPNQWQKLDGATVDCGNESGCLLSIAASLSSDCYTKVNSTVDGVSAQPKPFYTDQYFAASRQSAVLTRGRHVIETDVYTGCGATVGPWELDYTIYNGSRARS